MAQWKKKEYDVGDSVEFSKKQKTRRGVIIKRKRVRAGFTYVINTEDGGLVGPVFVSEINHCYRSMEDDNVASR